MRPQPETPLLHQSERYLKACGTPCAVSGGRCVTPNKGSPNILTKTAYHTSPRRSHACNGDTFPNHARGTLNKDPTTRGFRTAATRHADTDSRDLRFGQPADNFSNLAHPPPGALRAGFYAQQSTRLMLHMIHTWWYGVRDNGAQTQLFRHMHLPSNHTLALHPEPPTRHLAPCWCLVQRRPGLCGSFSLSYCCSPLPRFPPALVARAPGKLYMPTG